MTKEQVHGKYTSLLQVSQEALQALYMAFLDYDPEKAGYFQKANLSERGIVLLSSVSSDLCNVSADTSEIQLSEYAIQTMCDLRDDLYFAEHENDEIVELGIDIETYSSVDLTETGVYKYAEADDFEILLFAYSVNNSPVRVVDLASGELLPERVRRALTDRNVLKTAYNAGFERVCISRYLGTWLEPDDWDCTMVRAARLALPLSLDQCGKVLGLEQKKMKEGKALITYFSKPCKPTKKNGGRTRNLPHHAADKWETFKRYCKRDVEVEQAIRRKVTRLQISPTEREAWLLDQRINDRGALCDLVLAKQASDMDDEYRADLEKEAIRITGIENPNSPVQLKNWLKGETGLTFPSLDKDVVKELLPKVTSLKVKRLLRIRQELGKSSTAKYKAMLKSACKDNRIRGLFQFYGANRTGRFAGRLVQLQNLPQNHIADLDHARSLVRNGTREEVELEYGNVPQTLSELIRTAFIAPEGTMFYVCDFNAIEARVLAWVAGEEWVLDVFRNGGCIYCETASNMFHVPVGKHGPNAELRPKGKVATLACGYGGGVNALIAFGADKMGLTETEMKGIVQGWRNANPHAVRFWRHVETAARTAIEHGSSNPIEKGITFEYKWGGLCVTLPSKRQLFYPRMRVDPNLNRLVYEGMNQEKKIWQTIETYGGKMTENIIQAIARDCLIETMLALEKEGFKIVFHIHDETVIEVNPKLRALEEVEEIFGREIPWAKGLPLKGAGYMTPYYLKD